MSQNNDPDTYIVHERKLGPGYRFLVQSVVFLIFGAFMLLAGATWVKLETSENTTELLKLDSVIEAEIRKQDEEILNEGKALIKKLGRVYDVDGNPHPEWLQFLKDQRSTARARANGATVGERTSYLWDRITSVWK